MNVYNVELYVDGVLTRLGVLADDRDDAQESAINLCERNGYVHGNIVSIRLVEE